MKTSEIKKNVKDISLANVNASKVNFCQLWPGAKKALELLASMIKNPIGKAAIEIVIAAGDAIASKVCPVSSRQ